MFSTADCWFSAVLRRFGAALCRFGAVLCGFSAAVRGLSVTVRSISVLGVCDVSVSSSQPDKVIDAANAIVETGVSSSQPGKVILRLYAAVKRRFFTSCSLGTPRHRSLSPSFSLKFPIEGFYSRAPGLGARFFGSQIAKSSH